MSIDWNDPAARCRLIEQVGPERYNEAIEQHFRDSTVATVNGHRIRTVGSRFGLLYWVDAGDDSRGFLTLPLAEAWAANLTR